VTGVGEGAIAAPLAEAARTNAALSFGSYPFGAGSNGEVGTNLVVRGRDADAVEAAVDALATRLGAMEIAVSRP
jgi:molybdopterin-biosynthesis enzyme MoeA-like protein